MEDVETVMHADLVDDALRTLRAAPPGQLSRVSEAAVIAAHADHLVLQMVREARGAGSSWAQIAGALDTSTAGPGPGWAGTRQSPARGQGSRLPAPGRRGDDLARDLARHLRSLEPDHDLEHDPGLELVAVGGDHAVPAPQPAPRRCADPVAAP